MLAVVAITKKVSDERKRKKEIKQGVLSVGDSDVARQAFASEAALIQDGQSQIPRSGTEVKFEDPNDLDSTSPSTSLYTPTCAAQPSIYETKVLSTPTPDVTSPVQSENGLLSVASPAAHSSDNGLDTPRPRSKASGNPPAYSPARERSASLQTPSSMYSLDSSSLASDARSVMTSSTSSSDANAIRVKTKGSDLSSGFPYHPALFDLKVHPEKWSSFTAAIVDATKFGAADHAKMWAAATATAVTGAFATSVWVGRMMNRSIQEKKVKAGLTDMSDGGLGETLRQWNDDYFRSRGLFAHLELSESAMKNKSQKSSAFRKASLMYGKEERERKKEERKFVIVVTKLDDEGMPADAVHELGGELEAVSELPADEGHASTIAEMPADDARMPVELPAIELPAGVSLGYGNKNLEPPAGCAELDSDTTQVVEMSALDSPVDSRPIDFDAKLKPKPLMATANTRFGLYKETT